MSMKDIKAWKYLLGGGMTLCIPLVASANLVNDGLFTAAGTPNGSPGFTTYYASGVDFPNSSSPGSSGPTMGGWTVTAGSVDLIGTYWQGAGGGNSVDMSGNQNGTLSQDITLSAGTYKLTFDESGNPDGPPTLKELDVSLGGSSVQQFDYAIGANSRSSMNYVLQTAYFTVSGGSEALVFNDISASSASGGTQNPVGPANTTPWGAVIGNVSLTAVPEPTTLISGALMLLPFGASTLRILRRRVA